MVGCNAPVSAVLRLETPVDFDAIDGAPVDLLFVLLVPEAATDEHLELLRQIASMLDREEVRQRLREYPTTTACTGSSWMCRTVASAMGYRCG